MKNTIVKAEKNTLAHPVKDTATVDTFIPMALDAMSKGASIETLERMVALRNQVKAELAREAFNQAMAGFQGECPSIKKTKDGGKTKAGQVAYKYAPIDSIIDQVKDLLKKYELSYTIKIERLEGRGVKAICYARHSLGHSETSEFEVPIGGGTNVMSEAQIFAAASTFAKRYAFCNAFGIMTGDEDTDGTDLGEEKKFKKAVIVEAEKKLGNAQNIPELEKAWLGLPAIARLELASLKDELKKTHLQAQAETQELEGNMPTQGVVLPLSEADKAEIRREEKEGVRV